MRIFGVLKVGDGGLRRWVGARGGEGDSDW